MKISEVPKMIQQVLEYVREPKLAIFEKLRPTQKYIKKQRKSQTSLKMFAVCWAQLDPASGPYHPYKTLPQPFKESFRTSELFIICV